MLNTPHIKCILWLLVLGASQLGVSVIEKESLPLSTANNDMVL